MARELFDFIRQGNTLVCGTNRLARHLRNQYAQLQIDKGYTAWNTPDVLPWQAWLQRCWGDVKDYADPGVLLLNPEQQLYLWRDLIEKSHQSGQILQLTATAHQAVNAWNTVRQWQIPVFPEGTGLNEDAKAFLAWSSAYQKYCSENGLIDDTDILDFLIKYLSTVPMKKAISLAGFDELTPQQQRLMIALSDAGISVRKVSPDTRNNHISIEGYRDTYTEIRAAAHWARQLIETEAPCSIGIVVQNLRSLHALIENTFDDILMPGSILAGTDYRRRPYAIAVGIPLNEYPVIDTALKILDLGDSPVTLQDLSSLIRSSFILGANGESQQRAKFDACLRRYGEHRVLLHGLEIYAERYMQRENIPAGFLECCRGYGEIFQDSNRRQTTHHWAGLFDRLLTRFGWPGERIPDRTEYQTLSEWYSILERFAALDLVTSSLTFKQAVRQLRQIISGTSFQPETVEAPVQILGMSGTAAMQFDQLRITGLHEESWPPRTSPSPFIPIQLQREAGIPGASAETALSMASRTTEELIGSAPDVVLSYPESEQDRPLRPSSLIRDYPRREGIGAVDNRDYSEILFASRSLQELDDWQAPAVDEGQPVSGGTALFSDQAACPFRACARHRLGAEGLESKDIGLDARDRGLIMHAVMQRLWGKLKDHAALLSLPDTELDKIINQSVRSTIAAYRKRFPLTFSESFSRLEAGRIGTIIHDWFQLERERRPFSISALEYTHSFVLGGIEVRARIDRIDKLQDGRLVIIDYKTGKPQISSWIGDRPDEPQLPLYAITSNGEIAAVVFARLRQGESAFIGLAEEDDILPAITTIDSVRGADFKGNWQSLFDSWRDSLNRLARDFRNGIARVDPKGVETCTWCDLHSLCRIDERDTGYGIRDTKDD